MRFIPPTPPKVRETLASHNRIRKPRTWLPSTLVCTFAAAAMASVAIWVFYNENELAAAKEGWDRLGKGIGYLTSLGISLYAVIVFPTLGCVAAIGSLLRSKKNDLRNRALVTLAMAILIVSTIYCVRRLVGFHAATVPSQAKTN